MTDPGWAWKEREHERQVARFMAKHGAAPDRNQQRRLRRKANKALRKKREGWRYQVKKKGNWKARVCALSPSKFYKTDVWRELRQRVLETYGYKCMLCGSLDSMHVDHIEPRSRRPELALTFDNLQVLCSDCNREKSNIHAEDYREDAVAQELDRQTYLEAVSLGL